MHFAVRYQNFLLNSLVRTSLLLTKSSRVHSCFPPRGHKKLRPNTLHGRLKPTLLLPTLSLSSPQLCQTPGRRSVRSRFTIFPTDPVLSNVRECHVFFISLSIYVLFICFLRKSSVRWGAEGAGLPLFVIFSLLRRSRAGSYNRGGGVKLNNVVDSRSHRCVYKGACVNKGGAFTRGFTVIFIYFFIGFVHPLPIRKKCCPVQV